MHREKNPTNLYDSESNVMVNCKIINKWNDKCIHKTNTEYT